MPVCCLGVGADPPSAAIKARHVCLVRRISHYQDLSAKHFFLFGLGDAPGSPSKLYVTLLLCSFFISFRILSTSSPPFFFSSPPRTRSKHKASHLFAARRRRRRHTAEIQRYLFILLSQTGKKKKKNLKRTVSTKGNAKSKSISAPVRTMAYFAFLP